MRSTPEASVVRGAAAVAEGRCSALVSAGSTGATMTAALFALKRAQGVHRPALAVQIPVPGQGRPAAPLPGRGANTDVRPQHLIQFAFLGSAFSGRRARGRPTPRGACSPSARSRRRARRRGRGARGARPEPRDPLHRQPRGARPARGRGRRDRHRRIHRQRHPEDAGGDGARRSRTRFAPPRARARWPPRAGCCCGRRWAACAASMDPNAVGGAILLGLRGVAVVAHGSSTPEGIANAIRLADRAVRERAVERTRRAAARPRGATRGARAARGAPSGTTER